ncbi:MAG: cytochrome P450 [Actinomycetota bacterium]|nr:cytochrome P450 [Actinomycetota bacterium]
MPQTVTIDLLSPASFADGQPHEQFRWLREHSPVYRHLEPDGPGFWAVTRYDDVRSVGRDPEHFSSAPSILIPDLAGVDFGDHQMMITADPPRHTRLRRIINSQFTPRAAERLRARIEELAAQIIDAVIERGECDAVTDIAGEMPSFVIADLLGIPLDDGRRLYHLTETIHAAPDSVPPGAGMSAIIEMFNYAHQVAEEKRRQPRDDLASRILEAEVDGQRLDDIDFNLFFLLLIDAGGDTTRNLVGGGLLALFDHPDERRRLQEDLDGLLPSAVDEMLRWVSPVIYMRRTATRDFELAGRPIAAGDKVVMYYGSANRDERAFVEPDRFDVDRQPNEHIAFGGGGPHFCLGAHIARVETQALLRELLTRMPDIAPSGPAEWLASNFISGPRFLPVRFTPATRAPRAH